MGNNCNAAINNTNQTTKFCKPVLVEAKDYTFYERSVIGEYEFADGSYFKGSYDNNKKQGIGDAVYKKKEIVEDGEHTHSAVEGQLCPFFAVNNKDPTQKHQFVPLDSAHPTTTGCSRWYSPVKLLSGNTAWLPLKPPRQKKSVLL